MHLPHGEGQQQSCDDSLLPPEFCAALSASKARQTQDREGALGKGEWKETLRTTGAQTSLAEVSSPTTKDVLHRPSLFRALPTTKRLFTCAYRNTLMHTYTQKRHHEKIQDAADHEVLVRGSEIWLARDDQVRECCRI